MDFSDFLTNAKKLQGQVDAANQELEKMVIKGVSKKGDCVLTMSGKSDMLELELSDELIAGNKANLINTIKETYADAKVKIDAAVDRTMSGATDGLPLPNVSDNL